MTTRTFARFVSRQRRRECHQRSGANTAVLRSSIGHAYRRRCFGIDASRQFLHAHRLLKQHRGGERVDVSLPIARRAAHLAHRAERDGGGEAFVEQRDGKHRASRELGGDATAFDGAWRVVAFAVERQAHDDAQRLERRRRGARAPRWAVACPRVAR